MKHIFIVIYQDNSSDDDKRTSLWDADNAQYLTDEFVDMSFNDVFKLADEDTDAQNENPQLIKGIDLKKIYSEPTWLECSGLLAINEKAVIVDYEGLKTTVNEIINTDVTIFGGLMSYIKSCDIGKYDNLLEHILKAQNNNELYKNILTDINDPEGYIFASSKYRKKILKNHIKAGVRFINTDNTYVGYYVRIGKSSTVYPGTFIEGRTLIGENVTIGPDCILKNIEMGDNTSVVKSVITDSIIGNNCIIGPFAYIRPGSKLGNEVKVGDFVEIKNAHIDDKTKIPHLAYIGDSSVGRNTNIACGVITANYDGKQKYRTVIGNDAFVGCNVSLVAPVIINDGAYIAAGSTITDEVPANALAVARERQTVKENWVTKKGLQRKEK